MFGYLPALGFLNVTTGKLFVNQSRAQATHCTALPLAGVSAEKSLSTRSSAGEFSWSNSTPHCLGMPAQRNNLFHKFGALARAEAQFLAGVPTRQRSIDRDVLRKRPKPITEAKTNTLTFRTSYDRAECDRLGGTGESTSARSQDARCRKGCSPHP